MARFMCDSAKQCSNGADEELCIFAKATTDDLWKKDAFGRFETEVEGLLHTVIQGVPKVHCGRPGHFEHKAMLTHVCPQRILRNYDFFIQGLGLVGILAF